MTSEKLWNPNFLLLPLLQISNKTSAQNNSLPSQLNQPNRMEMISSPSTKWSVQWIYTCMIIKRYLFFNFCIASWHQFRINTNHRPVHKKHLLLHFIHDSLFQLMPCYDEESRSDEYSNNNKQHTTEITNWGPIKYFSSSTRDIILISLDSFGACAPVSFFTLLTLMHISMCSLFSN